MWNDDTTKGIPPFRGLVSFLLLQTLSRSVNSATEFVPNEIRGNVTAKSGVAMSMILVVDDDRLIRTMLENCLRNAGHAVLLATNGKKD